MPPRSEHWLRKELHKELHARPSSLHFDGDAEDRRCHWERVSAHLPKGLPGQKDVATPDQGTHGSAAWGTGD
jgi:hypothetical protein